MSANKNTPKEYVFETAIQAVIKLKNSRSKNVPEWIATYEQCIVGLNERDLHRFQDWYARNAKNVGFSLRDATRFFTFGDSKKELRALMWLGAKLYADASNRVSYKTSYESKSALRTFAHLLLEQEGEPDPKLGSQVTLGAEDRHYINMIFDEKQPIHNISPQSLIELLLIES